MTHNMELFEKACFSCRANLGHLDGCIDDYDSTKLNKFSYNPSPQLKRKEIIDKILEQFFYENNIKEIRMFKKAERKQSKLRLGISGPSGSGKTYSALLIAKGLAKKIAVLDTEKGSASLYSHLLDFDTVELSPPFTHDRYIQVIKEAEKQGYELLIIDSLSHAWIGEGGILDQKAMLDQNPRSNKWTNWKKPKENYTRLKNMIVFSKLHIICTFRAKQVYEQIVDESGSKKIEKLGLEPQTEPGAEYELTTIFDLNMKHYAIASKDRTELFDDQIFKPSEETGTKLLQWLQSGIATTTNDDVRVDLNNKPYITEFPSTKTNVRVDLNKKLIELYKPYITEFPSTNFKALLKERYQVEETRYLSDAQLQDFIRFMQNKIEAIEPIKIYPEFEQALSDIQDEWTTSDAKKDN